MTYTKEDLNGLTRDELIDLVLSLQSTTDKLDAVKHEASTGADTLFSWLWEKKRGDFVTATKREIMHHLNCTGAQYSKWMRVLFTDGRLESNVHQGKVIQSSYRIKEL